LGFVDTAFIQKRKQKKYNDVISQRDKVSFRHLSVWFTMDFSQEEKFFFKRTDSFNLCSVR